MPSNQTVGLCFLQVYHNSNEFITIFLFFLFYSLLRFDKTVPQKMWTSVFLKKNDTEERESISICKGLEFFLQFLPNKSILEKISSIVHYKTCAYRTRENIPKSEDIK